jgi:hypothetical protein
VIPWLESHEVAGTVPQEGRECRLTP